MALPQRYIQGTVSNSDKFALRLVTNQYIETLSFEVLKANGRAFNIYQWDNIQCKKDNKVYSGWVPWLHYARRKWSKYDKELMPSALKGPPLMPAHKIFESFNALKDWIGIEEYQNLLVDLI